MKTLKALLLSTFLLATFGCIDSPLLNHADASGSFFQRNTGCEYSFTKYGLCASVEWTKRPTDTEKGEFTIRFWNATTGTSEGPYVTPTGTVGVKLWMPGMGHGSSPVAVSAATDANGASVVGVYLAKDVYFVMGGMWEIWIQLRDGKEILDQAKTDLSIE